MRHLKNGKIWKWPTFRTGRGDVTVEKITIIIFSSKNVKNSQRKMNVVSTWNEMKASLSPVFIITIWS